MAKVASMLLAPVYDVSWERREREDMMVVACDVWCPVDSSTEW